jgi:hypothetical protein
MSPSNQAEGLTVSLSANPSTSRVLITLTPPKSAVGSDSSSTGAPARARTRASLDICCVIDVSGSMGKRVGAPGNPALGAASKDTGLSVLDIVKHSLKTIIATMQQGAYVSSSSGLFVLIAY